MHSFIKGKAMYKYVRYGRMSNMRFLVYLIIASPVNIQTWGSE